jgi:hypothetical protein
MYNKRWEEGFNEQFSYCFNVGVVPDDMTMERIKNFISALLEQKETEIRKETIKAVLPEEWNGLITSFLNAGFNECRQQIIKATKEKYNIDLE